MSLVRGRSDCLRVLWDAFWLRPRVTLYKQEGWQILEGVGTPLLKAKQEQKQSRRA